jgi:hypothetical protein
VGGRGIPADLRTAPDSGQARTRAGLGLVYRWSFKDYEGFPTVVVAGPDREHIWLYGHDPMRTMLRLHRPVVRFLLDALADVTDWFTQPRKSRGSVVWTLPRNEGVYPECVLIASDQRAWLHVYAMVPSVLRLNERTVRFLLDAVADLPAAPVNLAARSVSELDLVPPAAMRETASWRQAQ